MKNIIPLVSQLKMKILLALLVGFVIIDGIQTEYLVRERMVREVNPFLEPLVGDIGFMLLKIGGSLLCALIIWDIFKRMPRVAVATATSFLVIYGAIVGWNTSLFLLA